jgi:hypothetical protein
MVARIDRKWFQRGSGPKPPDFADLFFIGEIESQCEFALRAFGEMQQAYSVDKRHPSMLAMAHVLLVFAGNVGKLLGAHPSKSPAARARAQRLRSTLGLQAANFDHVALARNYLEHFDERMERFVGSHTGLLAHKLIDDRLPHEVELDDGRRFSPVFLQFLNTSTLEITLYDHSFALSEIVKTVEMVQASAKSWLASKGGNAA